jgi:hypothetical protein
MDTVVHAEPFQFSVTVPSTASARPKLGQRRATSSSSGMRSVSPRFFGDRATPLDMSLAATVTSYRARSEWGKRAAAGGPAQ